MEKFVFIDTNAKNEDNSYFVSAIEIKRQHLVVGDKVIAYQGNEMWNGDIVVCAGKWGVVLTSSGKDISDERFEGHIEGYYEGLQCQKLRTLNVLRKVNIPQETMSEIIKSLELE